MKLPLQAKECLRLPEARGEDGTHSLSHLMEGTNPGNILILDFWPLELGHNTFLLF